MKTKPFNLKDALSGSKVVTRDGREVTQLHLFKADKDSFPVSGVVEGRVLAWTIKGGRNIKHEHSTDLFIAVPIQRFWVNLYDPGNIEIHLGRLHTSYEDAKAWRWKNGYIKTIEITNEP